MKDLKTRLAEARAKKDAAEQAITEADRAEMAEREELAELAALAREAEEQKRGLDLARRLDAARDVLGDVPLRELTIKDSQQTFVIKSPGAKAYNDWEKGVSASVAANLGGGKPVDRAAVSRALAAQAIHDWNGIIDFGATTTNGDDLIKFLTAYPAIATEIVNVAVDLAKIATEARKSVSPHASQGGPFR